MNDRLVAIRHHANPVLSPCNSPPIEQKIAASAFGLLAMTQNRVTNRFLGVLVSLIKLRVSYFVYNFFENSLSRLIIP